MRKIGQEWRDEVAGREKSPGDPYGDEPRLSDKGAKDYKEANKAIENTSKMGGWSFMAQMAEKISEMAGLAGPFTALLDVFSAMVSAETADTVKTLYSEIFTEENISQLAAAAKVIGDVIQGLWDGLQLLDAYWGEFEKAVNHFEYVTTPKTQEAFAKWLDDVDVMGKELGESIINAIVEGAKDALGNIGGGGGRGGGGSGGGDDTWWNPFD